MLTEPRLIQVSRTLRPLRLAYLVDPKDPVMLQRVIEACTCRWGGMVSAIVPRYRRRPGDFPDKQLSATQIVAGYLATFEPDYTVEGYEGAAEGLGLDKYSHGSIESMEKSGFQGDVPWGTSAFLIHQEAYRREFRFQQRDPLSTVLPQAASGDDQLLVDTFFGRLPKEGELSFIGQGYEEAFKPTVKKLDASELPKLMLSDERLTPLNSTMLDLKRERMSIVRREPCFMIVRPSHPADLIDFWNLRAMGQTVAAVPATHIDEFVGAFAELQGDRIRRSRYGFQGEGGAVAIKAQGARTADLERFADAMSGAGFPLPRQDWLPKLWNPHFLRSNHWSRVPVEAASDQIEVSATEGRIRFGALSPKFVVRGGFTPSWANVIRLHESSWDSDLAVVLPPELSEMRRVLGTVGGNDPTACGEGIVVMPRFAGAGKQLWTLPTGHQVFAAWLQGRGFDTGHSAAGRTASQMIARLGGPTAAQIVQEPKLIKLINRAAGGLVEEESASGGGPRRRVIKFTELRKVLGEITPNSEASERRLTRLLQVGILRQGLMVRCDLCEQQNWYSLEDLEATLSCERCLQDFEFPRRWPPQREDWAYRPNGPFSIENYADGGYTVALALRFFLNPMLSESEATWTTSMELKGKGADLEFDFGLWLREEANPSDPPRLIFGECKSFNRFEARDLERTAQLATAFPASLLVLATLRDGLSEEERKSIEKLIDTDRGLAGRLIILTANELCGSDSVLEPPYSWKGMGGKFEQVAERYEDAGRFDLETLSRATVALYAGTEA